MTKNMGSADRAIRFLVVAVIAGLYLTGRLSGTMAIVLGIVALAFALTSLIGWCPLYLPIGLDTRSRSERTPPAA